MVSKHQRPLHQRPLGLAEYPFSPIVDNWPFLRLVSIALDGIASAFSASSSVVISIPATCSSSIFAFLFVIPSDRTLKNSEKGQALQDEYMALGRTLYANRALAYMGLEDWREALADTTTSVEVDPNWVSALGGLNPFSPRFLNFRQKAGIDTRKPCTGLTISLKQVRRYQKFCTSIQL